MEIVACDIRATQTLEVQLQYYFCFYNPSWKRFCLTCEDKKRREERERELEDGIKVQSSGGAGVSWLQKCILLSRSSLFVVAMF